MEGGHAVHNYIIQVSGILGGGGGGGGRAFMCLAPVIGSCHSNMLIIDIDPLKFSYHWFAALELSPQLSPEINPSCYKLKLLRVLYICPPVPSRISWEEALS